MLLCAVNLLFAVADINALAATTNGGQELILAGGPEPTNKKVKATLKKMGAKLEDAFKENNRWSYLVQVGDVNQAMKTASQAGIFSGVYQNHSL